MSFFSTFSAIGKYLTLAVQAVAQVQAEIGASNGDPNLQKTKLAAAIAIVLAAAHAGENVPIAIVQKVAMAVEVAVSLANMLGLFGKTANAAVTVAVPVAVAVPAEKSSTSTILD